MNNKKPTLEQWIERIRDQEMPIFGHTVQSILNVAEDEEAPAAKLATVVLQDASMTARVLKLANTIYYNPGGSSISTVSRAVVMLGFNTVRNMCLSITLVDALVHGGARDHLTKELSRAIHAAVQARTLAVKRGDLSPEEIFIATLLFHLGDMAFWCFSGQQGDELDQRLQQPEYTPALAQEEVLGFQLKQLTIGLTREWHLNDLLQETLRHPEANSGRGQAIVVSHKLAAVAEKHGWHSPEAEKLIEEIAKSTRTKTDELTRQLYENATEASRIATFFGAASAARAIPLPGAPQALEIEEEELVEYPEPDGMLQLRILRELSMLLEKQTNFNLIMEMVLEGIYRGVGMDRTLFALLTPDRRTLNAKYALGQGSDALTAAFHFTRHPEQRNIFFQILEEEKEVWADTRLHPQLTPLLSSTIATVTGPAPFFTAPIVVNGKSIGLIFADRALSGRALDQESFESFQHFVKQANMGLSLFTRKGR
jgi:HD-like signal output (HDOD) protein